MREPKCAPAVVARLATALQNAELIPETVIVYVDHGAATRRDRTTDVRFTVSGQALYRGATMPFAVGCLDRVSDVARNGVQPWHVFDNEIHIME